MMKDKTVLLVEDDANDELLTLRALKKGKIINEVTVVRDGQEALDYLFAEGKFKGRDLKIFPTLVLLDLKLPKIGGLDVLKRIRETPSTKLLPVVILTSSRQDRDVVESYNLGANSYICKPVDMAQFSDAIQQLGLYWLLLNIPAQ